MELLKQIKSTEDKTIKYIFKLHDGLIVETTYIDNNTGKDIICVPCQTLCGMGCTFCHLTDYVGELKLRNLTKHEIIETIEHIIADLKLMDKNRPLLISYMGSGEPLLNSTEVIDSMIMLMSNYDNIRFGLATSLPRSNWLGFFKLTDRVKDNKIPLKIHLSLHYTTDKQRGEFMPNSLEIKSSIQALGFYRELTGNPIEIHYTLIKDINDHVRDVIVLKNLLFGYDIPIKFIRFNSKESNPNEGAEKQTIADFRFLLEEFGISTEYYEPPGKDVGASCGQFLMDEYELHNSRPNQIKQL
jgi:23S rRNA (adenine2503-C2)-methyltransferase